VPCGPPLAAQFVPPNCESAGLKIRPPVNVVYGTCHFCTDGIEEFKRGSKRGRILGMQLTAPQGLIIADDGSIVLVETEGANRVDVFPPGSKTPSVEAAVPQIPIQIAMTASEHHLFVSTLQ
jgi:hypothetical protein